MAARQNPAKAGQKGAPAGGAQEDGLDNGNQLDAAAEAALVIAQAAQPESEAALPKTETPPVIIGGVPAHALKDIDKATPARTGARAQPVSNSSLQAQRARSSVVTGNPTETRNSMHRATKIVATIGPASTSPDILLQMLQAGLDVVRFNFSHGTADDHRQRAEIVREAARQVGREVAIMADLQGPKIRVGKFENNKTMLVAGNPFILDAGCELGNSERVGLDYKDLPRDLRAGDVLLLNDGLIVLDVTRVIGEEIHTTVKVGGELSNNKGINRQGGGLTAPALTEKDMEDIKTAMSLGADFVAVSFPKNATDMEMARQLANIAGAPYGIKPKMIAKIERAEAIPALQGILDASDGIMVARGDLAVEVGNAAVPALQKRMIRMARESNKLVITATQMMESMIHAPVPTRAEVSDVANAVLDGTDAVMLSAETAAGKYPVTTIETMAAVCIEAEKSEESQLDRDFLDRTFTRIDQSIAMGALFTAYHLGAKAVVALTESGSTALWMSRHWTHVPIFALTPRVASERTMSLYRNVTPLHVDTNMDRDAALNSALEVVVSKGYAARGDMVVLTVGEPMGQAGGTNTLKIVRVGDHF
ncbi:pyruvate kinase [Burkholderia sp. SFA1]|uniref:Pyruvate kinase n=2 Tax=Burkholderiaceae TaxID=119060 RepID=A0A158ENE1_CABCO|nr:pyruvate kinase [Burkholderia sp. RPE67]BBP95350.1 pyruvate kinase [Burkholderia sp. SFA1]SAL09047.1 pyruvate kinase [Caballeronia cordobensis]